MPHVAKFFGDLVCEAGLPSLQEARVFSWLEILSNILEMDVRYVVPGHENVCTLAEVDTFREQIEELVGRVRSGIAAGRLRDTLVEDIRFPGRIHIGAGDIPGYPNEMIEEFQ